MFLHKVLRDLGFYISYKKVLSPMTTQRYLGIDIDSVAMQLRLPEDKMLRLTDELTFFDGRRKATKRQLQRLCGILAHCAQLVPGDSQEESLGCYQSLSQANAMFHLPTPFTRT